MLTVDYHSDAMPRRGPHHLQDFADSVCSANLDDVIHRKRTRSEESDAVVPLVDQGIPRQAQVPIGSVIGEAVSCGGGCGCTLSACDDKGLPAATAQYAVNTFVQLSAVLAGWQLP